MRLLRFQGRFQGRIRTLKSVRIRTDPIRLIIPDVLGLIETGLYDGIARYGGYYIEAVFGTKLSFNRLILLRTAVF